MEGGKEVLTVVGLQDILEDLELAEADNSLVGVKNRTRTHFC